MDTGGGGALWFFFLSKLFFHFQNETRIPPPLWTSFNMCCKSPSQPSPGYIQWPTPNCCTTGPHVPGTKDTLRTLLHIPLVNTQLSDPGTDLSAGHVLCGCLSVPNTHGIAHFTCGVQSLYDITMIPDC